MYFTIFSKYRIRQIWVYTLQFAWMVLFIVLILIIINISDKHWRCSINWIFGFSQSTHSSAISLQMFRSPSAVFSGPSAVWLQCAALPRYRELCRCLQHSASGPIMEISKQPAVCSPGHLIPALTFYTDIPWTTEPSRSERSLFPNTKFETKLLLNLLSVPSNNINSFHIIISW